MGANTEWRKFALCIFAMTICATVGTLIAIAYPRHGFVAGWLSMWLYVRIESLIRRAP
jgi:predicted benzoate:H+ symporter BenE